MFSNTRLNSTLTTLVLLISQVAFGDTISLKNGDHITGNVTSMSGGRLIVDTVYASGINIDWTHIKTLQTEDALTLLMSDESVYEGKVIALASEKIVIQTKSGRQISIDAQSLEYINPPAYELDKFVWQGDVNLGMNATKGNSRIDNLHIDGELKFRNRFNRYIVGGQYNLQKNQGTNTAKNARANGAYHRFTTDKWYALLNTSASIDEFQDLNLRLTAGPGMGYEFWQSDLRNLAFEGGLNYTYEDFEKEPKDDYATLRWSLKFDHWLYKRRAQYFLTHTGLESVEDLNNLVLQTQTGFNIPIMERLKTKFELDIDFNNEPAAGRRKTDVKYLVTGGYTW